MIQIGATLFVAAAATTPDSTLHVGTSIAFAVAGSILTVRFDSVPAGGDLDIDLTAGSTASAQAFGPDADRAAHGRPAERAAAA